MNGETRFARSRIRACRPRWPRRACRRDASPMPPPIWPAPAKRWRWSPTAVLARACTARPGLLLLDPLALAAAPREIGLRALAKLLMTVPARPTGPDSRPWSGYSTELAVRPAWAEGATLHGCRLAPAPRRFQAFGPNTLVITRESSRRERNLRPGPCDFRAGHCAGLPNFLTF